MSCYLAKRNVLKIRLTISGDRLERVTTVQCGVVIDARDRKDGQFLGTLDAKGVKQLIEDCARDQDKNTLGRAHGVFP